MSAPAPMIVQSTGNPHAAETKRLNPKKCAGAGEELKNDCAPREHLVGRHIKSAREVLHDSGDAGAAPATGEDEISKKKTQGISNVESDRRNPRSVRYSRGASKGPGAESRHEAT